MLPKNPVLKNKKSGSFDTAALFKKGLPVILCFEYFNNFRNYLVFSNPRKERPTADDRELILILIDDRRRNQEVGPVCIARNFHHFALDDIHVQIVFIGNFLYNRADNRRRGNAGTTGN